MTIRYVELLDVDLVVRKWEEHELEAAVREWWKKVNSTAWNPLIAAANFRLRIPGVKELVRYPRAMADDRRLLDAIAERAREPGFKDEVIRRVVETKQFDVETLLRIPATVPEEVSAELEVLRRALGVAPSVALEHIGVAEMELPKSVGATLTLATLKGEYVDQAGDRVEYEQWIFDVYAPVRVRMNIERHGEDVTRTVMAAHGVAPLLDALTERGLAATALPLPAEAGRVPDSSRQ